MSFLLSVFMILGLIPPISGWTASVSKIYTTAELATSGISIIPANLVSNGSFMNNYVNRGGKMSLNGHFFLADSKNADGAGAGALPTGTIDGKESDQWYVSYKWDPSQAQRDIFSRSDVKMVFNANMIPVYSEHNYIFWKEKHWATAGIRLTRGDGNGNNTWKYGESDYGYRPNGDIIFKDVADTVNSGQAQAVDTQKWDDFPAGDKALFYNAYYLWEHDCCNPKTSGALFYAVDEGNPTISSVTFSNGTYTAIPRGGLTETVTVTFSENIRFADNAAHDDLKLYLDAEYLEQSSMNGGFQITANLVEMGTNYMKFQFQVKEAYQHIKISGLSANQPDLMTQTDLKVYDGNGTDLKATSLTASSRITDVAGNSLRYSKSYVSQYYDGVAPALDKIDMSGNDISAVSCEPSSWNANSGSLRFVYAGAGDKITFKAIFNENINITSDTSAVKAVLSIKDENGSNITLKYKRLDGDTVTFEDLQVTSAMRDAGERIYITRIDGMTVTDYAGNACVSNLTNGINTPDQQITLDVDKPYVTSIVTEDYILTTDPLVYRPYSQNLGGEYFSFPVSFRDFDNNGANKSGVAGTDMHFSLDMEGGGNYAYQWAMNTSQVADANTDWRNGTTGYQNTFNDLAEGAQYWVHIKLDSNTDYGFTYDNGIYFNGTLNFNRVSDWAGNTADSGISYTLCQQVDNKSPGGVFTSSISLEPDYANGSVTFKSSFKATDNYKLKKISYRWLTRLGNATEFSYVSDWEVAQEFTGEYLSQSFSVSPAYTYDYSADGAARNGQVKLEIMVEDLAGNKAYSIVSRPVSFNYELAKSNSSVTVNDPTNPDNLPAVHMAAPTKAENSVTENPPRSLLIIPLPDSLDENGQYSEFYIWDPWHWDTNGVENGSGRMEYIENPIAAIQGYIDSTSSSGFDLANYIRGSFYRAKGTVDLQTNSANFDSISPYLSKSALQEMEDFFSAYYGRMDLYIATTSSLKQFTYMGYVQHADGSASIQYPYEEDLEFAGAQTTIDVYTVYVVNDPQYKVETVSITNAEGLTDAENGVYKLDYSYAYRPAVNLDNVAVTVQITNESDKNAEMGHGFGLQFLDYTKDNAALKLYYTNERPGTAKPTSTPITTWDLVQTSDGRQTVVFEPGLCAENGWYTLWLVTEDTHSDVAIEQKLGQFFMDATVLDVEPDRIYKDYSADEDGESYEWELGDMAAVLQEDGVIKLGLAPAPEGWTMNDSSIYFYSTARQAGDSADPADMSAIRVYNQTYNVQKGLALDAGEWRDTVDTVRSSYSYHMYLADLSEETPYTAVNENGQTAYRLPFVEGRNLIVYERQSTNGVLTTHEMVIEVTAEAAKWDLEYEVFYANRPGYATSAEVWPVGAHGEALDLNTTEDLDRTRYNFRQVDAYGYDYAESYTYSDDVENLRYYLVEPNGNVSEKTLTIFDTDGTVLNIDSGAPNVSVYPDSSHPMYANSDSGYGSSYDGTGYTFFLTIKAEDLESSIDWQGITLTFDEAYSKVLSNGTMGEDGRITMPLPLAVDENGELLKNADGSYPVWEDFGTGHNGIFHTQMEETEEEDYWTGEKKTVTRIHVFGTWRYSVTEEELAELGDCRTLTVNVPDAYGNVTSIDSTYSYNTAVGLEVGYPEAIDWQDGYILEYGLTPEGVVGLYSQTPYSSVNGYGADDMFAFRDNGHMGWRFYTWEAPMITQDSPVIGETEWSYEYEPYMFTVTDLFGQTVTMPVVVSDLYGELGIDISFSTTEPTNQPVTVYANSTGNIEKIASIVASDGTVGTIDPLDPSKASITVENNCTVTIITDAEPASQRVVKVTNIDKDLGEAYVVYYDQNYNLLDPSEGATEVTAVLSCDAEMLFATNGPESYTFPAGSKKGDTYTFEYRDAAGNTGTITAVLPVDLSEPEGLDTEAPDLDIGLYAGGRTTYDPIDRFNLSGADEGVGGESMITAKMQDENYGAVRAKTFRLALTINDASQTKVIVAPAGTAIPASYAAAEAGSTVDSVSVVTNRNSATIDVTENTVFDLFVIDEAGNCTFTRNVRFTSIDNEAPVLMPDYETGTDPETGYTVVTATFYPPEDEKLTALTALSAGVASRQEIVQDADGNDVTVIRFYYIFNSNGTYSFSYEDDLGNVGTAYAEINGLTTDAAKVNGISWFGTIQDGISNVTPDKSDFVNRDITAQLRMNKVLSKVELFVYDAEQPDGCGAPVSADAPVKASFTAGTIDITYSENVDYQVVVRFTASANGRKGTYVLPAVACIDKTAPVVTLKTAELAANKRSIRFVFETSEPAVLSQNLEKGVFETEHQWVARDSKPVTLYFIDAAGNQIGYSLTDFDGLDTVYLEPSFSASADGTNPTDKPAIDLNLAVGDDLFVYVNKTAEADLNGTGLGAFTAGTWNRITLPEDAGVYILTLTDSNTGEELAQPIYAKATDRIAPVIELASATVLVYQNASVDTMMQTIHEGVTVTDNEDASVSYTVSGYPESTAEGGLYTLTYRAQDAAGNRITASRYLYIMDEGTPILWINGEVGLPYSTVYIQNGDEIQLTMQNMDAFEDQPVVIKFRKGLYTTGQMKYYATTVEDMCFSVTETGHYTIYVRSQDRTEFVTYIYVEG